MTENEAIVAAYRKLEADPAAKKALARLNPEERSTALYERSVHEALSLLRDAKLGDQDRALDAVLMMAHAKEHVPGRLGRQFAAAGVRDVRFKRLATDDRTVALDELRRLVQYCGALVAVDDLAKKTYWWGIESVYQSAKDALALDFYVSRPSESRSDEA